MFIFCHLNTKQPNQPINIVCFGDSGLYTVSNGKLAYFYSNGTGTLLAFRLK